MHQYRRNNEKSSNIETRLATNEAAITHIESSIVEMRGAITRGFDSIREEINVQEDQNRPRISTWAGWAAVVLIVIGMFGNGYIRDLNRLEKNYYNIEKTMYDHLSDGHPNTVENKITALDKRVEAKLKLINDSINFRLTAIEREANGEH